MSSRASETKLPRRTSSGKFDAGTAAIKSSGGEWRTFLLKYVEAHCMLPGTHYYIVVSCRTFMRYFSQHPTRRIADCFEDLRQQEDGQRIAFCHTVLLGNRE